MSTPYRIKGKTGEWEVILGLEVHAQVTSNAKLFSGAPVGFGAEENQNVSFVDAGMPGMLPVINEKCIEQAVRTYAARLEHYCRQAPYNWFNFYDFWNGPGA